MSKRLGNYDTGGGDEQLTPAYGVEILIPYIQHLKDRIIWLPFDEPDSEFVKVLGNNGFTTVATHIRTGKDFLADEPPRFDVIIGNPPYKNKRLFWDRCIALNKPFALLLPLNTLAEQWIVQTIQDYTDKFSILIPSRRMRFYNVKLGITPPGNPSFKAVYMGLGVFEKPFNFTIMEYPNQQSAPPKQEVEK